ncbi:MAG: tetratricopeptide repeat protein [Gammaproteobacteria bacterium]|nr:tetratricopeptide repeat protein [Gammaproteobacteria bacterium]
MGGTRRATRKYRKQRTLLSRDFANFPAALFGLGNNALARGNNASALTFYQNAYQTEPDNLAASYNLALIYRRLGDTERARYFENITRNLQTTR